MRRVGVLISGRGSNLQALLDAAQAGQLGGEVVAVVSNVAGAAGLERAHRAGVPAFVQDHRGRTRDEHDAAVRRLLEDQGVELVCLAGYMRLLTPAFLNRFQGRIINIHPGLLPAFGGRGFYGRRVHEAVLAAGLKVSGATVHFVDEEYDHGPIILQREVPVEPGDTPETLGARVLAAEHLAYPEAVRLFADGRIESPSS